MLIQAQDTEMEQGEEALSTLFQEIISKIQEFNRICKRKKKKRKGSDKKEANGPCEESEEESLLEVGNKG